MRVPSIKSFCAIGPDGKIDVDMIRRNQMSCHSAAANIIGGTWGELARKGWRVLTIRISVEEDNIPPLADVPPPPAAAAHPTPALRRVSVQADAKAGLLRVGYRRKELADA